MRSIEKGIERVINYSDSRLVKDDLVKDDLVKGDPVKDE